MKDGRASGMEFVHTERLSFKRNHIGRPSKTGPMSRVSGYAGSAHQGKIDPFRLVFIDETWAKTNMAPLRGWWPVGQAVASQRRRSATGRP